MASEESFCNTCLNDKRKVVAVSYCVDCKSCFCKTCLRDHNKFPTLKDHKILNKTMMKSMKAMKSAMNKGPKYEEVTSEKCTDHHGNPIEMYCLDHDVMCCSVCVAVDHRSCRNVQSVATLAKGIFRSPDRMACKTSLDKTRRSLEQLKAMKTKELADLNKSQADTINKITNFKKRLIARIEHLEKISIEEVLVKHKEIAAQLTTDINSLDHMLKSAETQLKNIDKFKGDNEAQFFLHVKNGQKVETTCLEFMEQVQGDSMDQILFELNPGIETYLHQIESLNCKTKSTALVGVYDVKAKTDKAICDIRDICLLDNDQLVITDRSNDTVKRLDKNYKVKEVFDMPGGPFGVCSVGTMEIAVSLLSRERVQFVKVGKNMSTSKSFGVERHCRGICFCMGELYVCCGGGYNEGVGHVRVFNLQGLLLRTFQHDKTGQSFLYPIQIEGSLDGAQLYIADKENGLHVINRLGHSMSLVSDVKLDGIASVCIGDHGQLYICCINSHNVFKIEKSGGCIEELVTRSDGIKNPQSVIFLKGAKLILVCCKDSSKIYVFKAK